MKYSIFGESHGATIGVVLDSPPPGLKLDLDEINFEMSRRAPGKSSLATSRKEVDKVDIISGFFEGCTTGTPLCGIIQNSDTRSSDYTRGPARPGHADYTAQLRYGGFADYRGGGHFSGRLTAPLVFAGAVAKQYLKTRGICAVARIKSIAGIEDDLVDINPNDPAFLLALRDRELAVFSEERAEKMREAILSAKSSGDSVGGVIECFIFGLPGGLCAPGRDCAESLISREVFAIPGIKGIEFGAGFGISGMSGSEANDELYSENGAVFTKTNNSGGINGGITNGMPVVFSVAVRPTPTIAKTQATVDIKTLQNTEISSGGRHDPCIVPRALPVVEAVAALAACEMLGVK